MALTFAGLLLQSLTNSGIVGAGQAADAAKLNTAQALATQMVAQWARKRWLVWALQDVAVTSTGAQSYTIGTGQNFNTPRPDRLEDGCFLRQITGNQPVDYPMTLLPSREDYSRIVMKTMGTFPQVVFYDSAYPVGNVFFWPVPQAATYELHVLVKTPLAAQIGALSASILMPDEYLAALDYNLQVRLRSAFRLPADPVIVGLARDALNTIRGANTQIESLRMPRAVTGRRRSYNPYSDT